MTSPTITSISIYTLIDSTITIKFPNGESSSYTLPASVDNHRDVEYKYSILMNWAYNTVRNWAIINRALSPEEIKEAKEMFEADQNEEA